MKNVFDRTSILLATFTLPCVGVGVNLGQCISGIYVWSLAIVGLAAFVQIIWAGWIWLTAFGNTNKAGAARSKITNAILGIILLFASYLILNTINPDLLHGTVNLPKIITKAPVSNFVNNSNTSNTSNTRIENFNVTPAAASLSANTPLAINLSIFASDLGVQQACVAAGYTGSVTDIRPGFIVWAVDLSKSPNPKMLFRADPAVGAFGASGKAQSFNFSQPIGTAGFSNGGAPFSVKFYAEFTCGNGGGVSTVMNASTPINVVVQP